MMVIVWLTIGLIPASISLWALLDCARRPPWAWSFAGRSQVAWLGAIAFGFFLLIFGVAVSVWYLLRVRPAIAAVEDGNFAGLTPPPDL
jgi:hypothetical protein